MINFPRLVILLCFIFTTVIAFPQLIKVDTINIEDPNITPEDQIIEWVLGTLHGGGGYFPDSTVTGINFTGDWSAIGYYWDGQGLNGEGSSMDTGLVLSNGRVKSIEKANTVGYTTDRFGTPGDEDLAKMYMQLFDVNGSGGLKLDEVMDTTGDAAVLEFLYRPYGDTITLRYVFASEEYQFRRPDDDQYSDFTGYGGHPDQMFDMFGIHIDQPSRPFLNIAEFTPAQDPPVDPMWVNIYNVNHNTNSDYYIGNGYPPLGPDLGNTFDGQTNNSEIYIIKKEVNPCGIYKVKIAIEDFWFVSPDEEKLPSGYQINSAVFLGGASLTGGKSDPTWTTSYEYVGIGANDPNFEDQLIEGGCREMLLTYTLNNVLPDVDTAYDIPFRINSAFYRDSLIITYEDGSPLYSDSVIFYPGEIEKTIRISAGDISADHAGIMFAYPTDPCEKPNPPFGGSVFSEIIEFGIRDNSPINVSTPDIYEAYCKDEIDISVVSQTSGGVSPLDYFWNGAIVTEDVHTQKVNNSPEIANVLVRDGCDNETTAVVQINNLPIIFNPIQSIFLCGPGQEATVPVLTFKPDAPDYSIEHVEWWRSDPLPIVPIGDEDGDQITVEYDVSVGDAIWTCEYVVTDICGATSDNVTADFEVNQSSLTLNNQGICQGDQVELYTGTPAHWYKWYKMIPPNDSVLILNNNPATDNPTSTSTYKLWIEDNCGEVQSATMTVYVDDYTPQISLVPSDGELCNGESITLTANDYGGIEGNVTYMWSNGSTNREITVALGEYALGQNDYSVFTTHDYLPYYICDNNANTQFMVYENPSPLFAIDPSEHACTNTDVQFDYLSDTTNTRTFAWNFDDGSPIDNQAHTTHQYTNPGTYNVYLYVEHTYPSGHMCFNDITKPLTVDPLPEPDFTADIFEGCIPVFVNFYDNTQELLVPGATYEWTFGDGGAPSTQTNPSHEYTTEDLFDVSLTVYNTERCFASITKPDYIQVNPNPTAGLYADPWITTMDTPTIDFSNLSKSDSTIISYEWDFGDGFTSGEENPSHTFDEAGDYIITLRIETINGCYDDTIAMVALTEYVQLFIPNAFTPNGDGFNDTFEIKGTSMADYNLYIYNRWGQQIWSTHNFENMWNGEDMYGNPVESGSYIYRIQGTDYQKTPVLYDGTVNVVR